MKLLGILGGIAVALYALYALAFPSATVRYRLTLEAQVDGKPVVGSGVIEVTREDTSAVFGAMGGVGAIITGEAVTLDLAPRGKLFALLRGHNPAVAEDQAFPAYAFLHAFGDQLDRKLSPIEQMRGLQKQGPKTELPSRLLPMLVRFRDINDPKTVEQVDPQNLAASFGPGVSLRRVTMEITDDSVTGGIEQELPWLADLLKRGGALDGTRFSDNNSLRSNLGALAFKRGGI
jgi:hypothetical protein